MRRAKRRTAAAVGNTLHVLVACPRYAATSCLCRSLPLVTPPYHTFLLNMGKFNNRHNLDPNKPVLTHLRPQRQFFNKYFFCFFSRRSQMTDSSRQPAQSKTLRLTVVGPCMCACRILSLRWRFAFAKACHVLSFCSLVPNRCCLRSILQ